MSTSYFVVAGNIGVGKSSLVEAYGAARSMSTAVEPSVENPYLADFYRDMPRWSFPSQIFFLAHRLSQLADMARAPGPLIQDRSLYEDAEIFAANLAETGAMSARDAATYRDLYAAARRLVAPPVCVVYLKASLPTLQARIAKRGRAFEASIDAAYLSALNRRYDAWAAAFDLAPVVTIDTDDRDFIARATDRTAIFAVIDAALRGLRPSSS